MFSNVYLRRGSIILPKNLSTDEECFNVFTTRYLLININRPIDVSKQVMLQLTGSNSSWALMDALICLCTRRAVLSLVAAAKINRILHTGCTLDTVLEKLSRTRRIVATTPKYSPGRHGSASPVCISETRDFREFVQNNRRPVNVQPGKYASRTFVVLWHRITAPRRSEPNRTEPLSEMSRLDN